MVLFVNRLCYTPTMRSAAVDVVTFEEAVADPAEVLVRAVRDAIPVIVSRPDGESMVVLSLSEWNSWQETLYLYSTEANRRALDESIAQADRGELVQVELGPDGFYRAVESTAL